MEVWKQAIYYKNNGEKEVFPNYEVSNKGNVKSYKNGNTKILKQCENHHSGYKHIVLYINNKQYIRSVSRLVFSSHEGEIEKDLEIDHKDKNKENNNLNNLRKLTKPKHGLVSRKFTDEDYIYFFNKEMGNLNVKQLCEKLNKKGFKIKYHNLVYNFKRLAKLGKINYNANSYENMSEAKKGNSSGKLKQWKIDKIKTLTNEGESISYIMNELNVSKNTVLRYRKELKK